MNPWQMWVLLCIMLTIGDVIGVGIRLRQFAIGALVTALGALAGVELEQQLDLFLVSSLALLLLSYAASRRAGKEDTAPRRTVE